MSQVQRSQHSRQGCLHRLAEEDPDVGAVGCLVEVDGQKPTGSVFQNRIYTDRFLASQMIVNHPVSHGEELVVRAGATFSFGLAARRRITCPSFLVFPTDRIHVFTASKQASKQTNLFVYACVVRNTSSLARFKLSRRHIARDQSRLLPERLVFFLTSTVLRA